MNYKNIENDISQMVNEELAQAREKFRNMASGHEGYAVILEEIEELETEEDLLKFQNGVLWVAIKSGQHKTQSDIIRDMQDVVINTIKEAVQVAAMLQRFKEDVLQVPCEKEGKEE